MVYKPRIFGRRGPPRLCSARPGVPVMMAPYTRIVGKHPYGTPPFFAVVQTNGSYYANSGKTRVAAILKPSLLDHLQKRVVTVENASSSTEAEWHSVAVGLGLALEEGEECIALENDNLGVIHGLITPGTAFRHEYARYYKDIILQMARHSEYVGARWIPRECNKADALCKEYPLA